jgi:hypothetical protein
MSDFRLRPRRGYATPAYPSPERAPEKAPLLSNAARPFLPLTFLLVGAGDLRSHDSHDSHAITTTSRSHALTLPQSSEGRVQRLSETEIDGLLGGLRDGQDDGPRIAVMGKRAAISGFLTEAEARSVLAAFLRKNGLEAKPATVRRDGVDFEADALDGAKGIGVEIRGAKGDCTNYNFQHDESDLSDDEAAELELLRAKGELRVLVLDGRAYEYDKFGDYRGRLPDKKGIVRRLLADLERFLAKELK